MLQIMDDRITHSKQRKPFKTVRYASTNYGLQHTAAHNADNYLTDEICSILPGNGSQKKCVPTLTWSSSTFMPHGPHVIMQKLLAIPQADDAIYHTILNICYCTYCSSTNIIVRAYATLYLHSFGTHCYRAALLRINIRYCIRRIDWQYKCGIQMWSKIGLLEIGICHARVPVCVSL